jgi:hypothetical protein
VYINPIPFQIQESQSPDARTGKFKNPISMMQQVNEEEGYNESDEE